MNSTKHESAKYHVTGEAKYIDDMPVSDQLLHGFVYTSPYAYAKIKSFDLTQARKVKGVHAVISHKDIPGENQIGPVIHDEETLASQHVVHMGQAMFIIAAETERAALEAKKLIKVEFQELKPILTIEDAIKNGELLAPTRKIERGNISEAFQNAENIIEGEFENGAQEHWYLETQIALCIPGEGNDMQVYSSTQNPMETQLLVAENLGIKVHEVEVEIRRMGGAFGGKETQANHIAAWAAILANATKRPVKLRLQREEDQIITGKRHPFLTKYKIAFDKKGKITAADIDLNANGGSSNDLTMAILERAMLHAENTYYIPNIRILGNAWKTNLPSNVAYRGFGGPQGMAVIENVMVLIAQKLGLDTAKIQNRNFYNLSKNNITPYGQKVKNNRLPVIWASLMKSSNYESRRKEVNKFNKKNKFVKRGIALMPVKFGISFTSSFLNQAGSLVNIYMDGTVLVNHGGTEMGQGLNTKMQQIAAKELGIPFENVKVNATNTSKIPNTSPTAASSGADMNGMAVKIAIEKIKKRIAKVLCDVEFNKNIDKGKSKPDNIVFENGFIFDKKNPERRIDFAKAMPIIRFNRTSLSATGFYKTPGVNFDRDSGTGEPFFYFAFGMAITEIELDALTGYVKILQTDILHDVGESLNKDLDIGQVEGGFIQGVGWCITEDCKWNEKGKLLNNSPGTYKIPTIRDIPQKFNVQLLEGYPNPNTIRRSKAVGEPPFMLGLSSWFAIKDAISSIADYKKDPKLSIPATNEAILLAIDEISK